MKKDILIKGGTVINSDGIEKNDVYVKNGIITEVAPSIETRSEDTVVIDAHNKYIMPGGIDPHVHFSLSGDNWNTADDFFTGSLSALAGGTTTIIDFVTPSQNESLYEAFQKRKKQAENCAVDYALHGTITRWDEHSVNDLKKCISTEGMRSVKIYLAYTDTIGLRINDILKALQAVSKLDLTVLAHCEDDELIKKLRIDFVSKNKTSAVYHALSRPISAETNAIKELLKASENTSCPVYFVHISSSEGVNLIKNAAKKGAHVFVETCTQYLLLDDSLYTSPDGNNYILSPPLRNTNEVKKLWDSLTKGEIDVVATDHCAFNTAQKNNASITNFTQVPNGLAGVENRLSLLFHHGVLKNKISLKDFVKLTSTQAAKIFGLYPRKGVIAKDADADIIIFDPTHTHIIKAENLHQKSDYSAYENKPASVIPETLIAGGKVLINKGIFSCKNVKGTYLFSK